MNSYSASHIYCLICSKFGRGRPEPKAFALVRLIRIAEGKAVIPFWETKQITFAYRVTLKASNALVNSVDYNNNIY